MADHWQDVMDKVISLAHHAEILALNARGASRALDVLNNETVDSVAPQILESLRRSKRIVDEVFLEFSDAVLGQNGETKP